jgi:hypothetical protein
LRQPWGSTTPSAGGGALRGSREKQSKPSRPIVVLDTGSSVIKAAPAASVIL